ncbi:hypothetical protein GmHk_20G056836 [Glycine max]|nr:hypothetical protein GmHk_20G056836 [Glycine max]
MSFQLWKLLGDEWSGPVVTIAKLENLPDMEINVTEGEDKNMKGPLRMRRERQRSAKQIRSRASTKLNSEVILLSLLNYEVLVYYYYYHTMVFIKLAQGRVGSLNAVVVYKRKFFFSAKVSRTTPILSFLLLEHLFILLFAFIFVARFSIVFNYEVDGGGDCESKFGDSDLKVVDIAFNGAV